MLEQVYLQTFSVVGNMIHNANTRYYHKGRCHLVKRVDITNISPGGENRHYSATRWKELTLLFCQLVERISTSTCHLMERSDTTNLPPGGDNLHSLPPGGEN